MTSGYTSCACRDCFDIAVSDDMGQVQLCSLCVEADCRVWDGTEGWQFDCQRIEGTDINDVPQGQEWRINK